MWQKQQVEIHMPCAPLNLFRYKKKKKPSKVSESAERILQPSMILGTSSK